MVIKFQQNKTWHIIECKKFSLTGRSLFITAAIHKIVVPNVGAQIISKPIKSQNLSFEQINQVQKVWHKDHKHIATKIRVAMDLIASAKDIINK